MKGAFGVRKFRLWRNKKPIRVENQQLLHWTKLDKPIGEMSPEERRAAAEKIALESLRAFTKDNYKSEGP
jgi:hypothetical protein